MISTKFFHSVLFEIIIIQIIYILFTKKECNFFPVEKKPMLTQLKHRETETGEVKCGYRRLSLGAFSHVSTDREPSRLFTMHVKLKQFLKGNLYYKKYK